MAEIHNEQHLQEPEALPWQELVAPIFRRRKLIAAVVVVGVALSTALAWMEPPLYEATATLIVRPKRADITVSPDAGSGVVMERLGTEAINSQVQLLESRELLRGVLAKYISEEKARQGVERPPNLMEKLTYPLRLPQIIYNKMHDVPDPDPLERMVSVVQQGLAVYPATRSPPGGPRSRGPAGSRSRRRLRCRASRSFRCRGARPGGSWRTSAGR